MPEKTRLIEELMSTDPLIEEFITTEGYLMGRVGDSVEINTIVNDCFMLLLGLLSDRGIVFHLANDPTELLDDYYQARHLILLYRLFTIESLVKSMAVDDTVFERVRDVVYNDINDNEVLLSIISVYPETQEIRDMKVFIEGKVASTPLYSTTLRNQVAIIENSNGHGTDSDMSALLDEVMTEREIFNHVVLRASEIDVSPRTIRNFRKDLIASDVFPVLATLYSDGLLSRCQPFIDELKRTHPAYVESRRGVMQNGGITDEFMLSNICITLGNERLFDIPPDYSELIRQREDARETIGIVTEWYKEGSHGNN